MTQSLGKYLSRENLRAKFLDRVIPLKDGSHADVVDYAVDTPWRYTECFAELGDGRKVRLRDARQFVAWARQDGDKRFLFRGHFGRIELLVPGRTSNSRRDDEDGARKFVLRDGAQLRVRRWGRVFEAARASEAGRRSVGEILGLAGDERGSLA